MHQHAEALRKTTEPRPVEILMLKRVLAAIVSSIGTVIVYIAIIGVQAVFHIGPFGELITLAENSTQAGFINQWFSSSDHFIHFDRWLFWPVALLIVSLVYVLLLRWRSVIPALIIALPGAVIVANGSLTTFAAMWIGYAAVVWTVCTAVETLRRRRPTTA